MTQNIFTMCLKNLWVRRNLSAGIALLSMVIGAFIISLHPVIFVATVEVELSPKAYDVTSQDDVTGNSIVTAADLERESNLLRERSFLLPIINRLKLQERDEFLSELEKKPSLGKQLETRLFPSHDTLLPPEDRILTQIEEELDINIRPTQAILSYSSVSPYLARAIVNAIAQDYEKLPTDFAQRKIIALSDLPMQASGTGREKEIGPALLICILIGIFCAIVAPRPPRSTLNPRANLS